MVRIAPVNLYYNPKTLWFDPRDLDIRKGDAVVVLTARGLEFGRAAGDVFEADESQVKKLKTALKPVKRLATEEDVEDAAEMERRSAEALPIFKEMAAETSEDMHPVSVEYLLSGDKAVFYFEAEERVDFRELVRRLAAHFHVRIDMRQIGVRDEARIVGGLGHCGQELCCKRMGGEFCPVSIRMAKEQDLSLNPQKISGLCGRLMCCLRYEFDAYKDFKSRAPKQNALVETPDGPAKVVDLDVPREIVSLRVEGEKPVKVPLADFEPNEEGGRPNRVGAEAWERATSQQGLNYVGEPSFSSPQFTGTDKLADPASVHKAGGSRSRKNGKGGSGGAGDQSGKISGGGGRKPRRRRSTKVGGKDDSSEKATNEDRKQKGSPGANREQQKKRHDGGKQRSGGRNGAGGSGGRQNQEKRKQKGSPGAKQGPRPGQKSSGLRQQKPGAQVSDAPTSDSPANSGAANGQNGHRRTRRRSHKTGGTGSSESGGSTGTRTQD